MRIQFVTFIIIASAIVFAAHLAVYYSWLRFFNIADPWFRRILGLMLMGLSISFIISSILVHWKENFLTGGFYVVSAAWLGSFLYLLIAVILIWLLYGVLAVTGLGHYLKMVATVVTLLASLYALYGLWNAENPQIHNVTVSIRNLPASWQGRKIVQISDIHLGAIHRRWFMQQIVDKINKVDPDVVFITGDLFDGAGTDLNHLADPLKELHPPLGTYFITGNHESYVGIDRCLQALESLPITICKNQVIDLDSVQLLGINYVQGGQKGEVETALSHLDRSRPSIVLYHVPTAFDLFKQAGVNFQLAGHTHKGQMWPFNYITHKVYGGRDCGLFEDGDYTLYVSNGTGTWGPPLRTGNTPEIVVFSVVNK